MDKLIIALMIPGSIILCLVAGKRLWVRAVAIVVLLPLSESPCRTCSMIARVSLSPSNRHS